MSATTGPATVTRPTPWASREVVARTAFRTVVVVPCHDEAARLPREEIRRFLETRPATGIVFVDDGSRDATASVLEALCAQVGPQASLVRLPRNRGKAEAVRAGMLHAMQGGARYVAFWDADLATPLSLVPAFAALLEERPHLLVVMGARVQLLGARIQRRPLRHYAGRVFATAASLALDLPVYDTQCGAKMFRVTDEIRALFAEEFTSGWIFDVELLARLLHARRRARMPEPERCLHEFALPQWTEVGGSKVSLRAYFTAAWSLARIWLRYRRPT